jgi:hypothetical protein
MVVGYATFVTTWKPSNMEVNGAFLPSRVPREHVEKEDSALLATPSHRRSLRQDGRGIKQTCTRLPLISRCSPQLLIAVCHHDLHRLRIQKSLTHGTRPLIVFGAQLSTWVGLEALSLLPSFPTSKLGMSLSGALLEICLLARRGVACSREPRHDDRLTAMFAMYRASATWILPSPIVGDGPLPIRLPPAKIWFNFRAWDFGIPC